MDKIHRFFGDNWAVRRGDFHRLAASIVSCLTHGNPSGAAALLGGEEVTIRCAAPATSATPQTAEWWDFDDMDLPENSVGVIRMRGMLYSWTTELVLSAIREVESNPKICGLVLDIDGPGGMASHVEELARAIEGCAKPVVTVVTGCMASAHFWIGTAAGTVLLSSPTCEIGSVGVLIPYMNLDPYLRQLGVDVRDIYPDTADLKNGLTRAIEENDDEEPVKKYAEKLHRLFSDAVARQLGVDYDPELPLFRGEMFAADEAIALGYADGYGDVAEGCRRVLAQAAVADLRKNGLKD